MLDNLSPKLPPDPNKAGAELTQRFYAQGRWPRYEKPFNEVWAEMSEEEKRAYDTSQTLLAKKFDWLLQMVRSETLWFHAKIQSNAFSIHAFRFRPHDDSPPGADLDPNGYVVFLDFEEHWERAVLYLQNGDSGEWKELDLKEMLDTWNSISY